MKPHRRALIAWFIVGATGLILLPWYALQDSVLGVAWLRNWSHGDNAPALLQAFRYGRSWLLPLFALLASAAALLAPRLRRKTQANGLIAIGATGFAYFLAQGFAIGPAGWNFAVLADVFGPLSARQFGMGL